MAKNRVSYGEVALSIGGKEYKLINSPEVLDKLEKQYGGVLSAIERARGVGPRNLAEIIAIGSSSGQKAVEELRIDIWKEGAADVAAKVIEFLAMVLDPSGKYSEETKQVDTESGE